MGVVIAFAFIFLAVALHVVMHGNTFRPVRFRHAGSVGILTLAGNALQTPGNRRRFDQEQADRWAGHPSVGGQIILLCGRDNGFDERVREHLVTDQISIGDYVLSGGELAAMVVIDAVTRQIPGTLGGEGAAEKDSFSNGLLEHAHYTRPQVFEGKAVPEILLSGHHEEIENWRVESAMLRTLLKRPDLLKDRTLSKQQFDILKKWHRRIEEIIKNYHRGHRKRRE